MNTGVGLPVQLLVETSEGTLYVEKRVGPITSKETGTVTLTSSQVAVRDIYMLGISDVRW